MADRLGDASSSFTKLLNRLMENKQLCFVILCGLPASGKSALASELINKAEHVIGGSTNCRMILLSYDNILPNEDRKICQWSAWRKRIPLIIESYLTHFGSHNIRPEEAIDHGHLLSWCETSLLPLITNGDSRRIIVIVDDNMYYHSMRYQYYQLCQSLKAGYCQVFLDCPLGVCLERNEWRSQDRRVEGHIIHRMAECIEVPLPDVNSWERNSVIVKHSDPPADFLAKIHKLIQEAFANPVSTVLVNTDRLEESKESRQQNATNLYHQTDQILRQLVSSVLSSPASQQGKDGIRELSTRVHVVKKAISDHIKTASLPVDITGSIADASKSPNSPLYLYISSVFNSMITNRNSIIDPGDRL